ncbi:MAG: ribosome silencing factor [Firmicutes bacterium]|nr:ribosome silencing factor [Bacillota bacterium]
MDIKKASLKQKNKVNNDILAKEIASLLSSKKAHRINLIEVTDQTVICDYFVICSAKSTTAVKALVDYLDEVLSKKGIEPKGRDFDVKWAAVDYGSVIVHVFHEELRDIYKIEKLWVKEDNSNLIIME